MKRIAILLAVAASAVALAGAGETTRDVAETTRAGRHDDGADRDRDRDADRDRDDRRDHARPAKPKPTTVTIRVVGGVPQGGIARPKVKKGDRVVIVVRADAGESVHVHGYDVERTITPGQAGATADHGDHPGQVRGGAPPPGRGARGAHGQSVNLVAHGIGTVQDLPIPAWLFYWGAGVVLVVSFVLLGALWKRPLLAAHAGGRAAGRTVLAARARPAPDRRPGPLASRSSASSGPRRSSGTPTRSGTSRRRGST